MNKPKEKEIWANPFKKFNFMHCDRKKVWLSKIRLGATGQYVIRLVVLNKNISNNNYFHWDKC